MVQTRTRDHGVFDKAPKKSTRKGAVRGRKNASNNVSGTPKRARSNEELGTEDASLKERGADHADQPPPRKKTKNDHKQDSESASAPASEGTKTSGTSVAKVHDILSKYGTLPLSDIGLKQATVATPETVLAFVFNAMLTSARISHELAYKSVKFLIEAGYHDIHTLKQSSWQERTEVLTRGGYTRYREKTATALGELADYILGQYGLS